MRTFGAIAAAASCLGVGSAGATVVTATYTGTVAVGTDINGYFGPKNGNLTGDQYSITYNMNAKPDYSNLGIVMGGSKYGTLSPITSVDITINNVTFVDSDTGYDASVLSSVQGIIDNGTPKILDFLFDASAKGSDSSIRNEVNSGPPVGELITYPNGFYMTSGQPCCGFTFNLNGTTATLDDAAVLVTGVPAFEILPEPDTWVVMLVGFSGIGAVLRRRRPLAAT